MVKKKDTLVKETEKIKVDLEKLREHKKENRTCKEICKKFKVKKPASPISRSLFFFDRRGVSLLWLYYLLISFSRESNCRTVISPVTDRRNCFDLFVSFVWLNMN